MWLRGKRRRENAMVKVCVVKREKVKSHVRDGGGWKREKVGREIEKIIHRPRTPRM